MSRYDEPTQESGPDAGVAGQAAEAPFLSPGARFHDGRYVLERVLGHGGMAAVWLARDRRLERPVAVKVLSDTLAGDRDYLIRFEREARVAAGLTHPGLIRIYDFGAERGRPFLVMEYVDGGDLGERLEAGRAPDPERLARELLGALRHIHGAGVLHRDVKAPNVLIGTDGHARLTDFGIAQPIDATSLTQPGLVLGTARYLAPEVLEGSPPSERSDLYSLGVVLAEALAARPGGRGLAELVEALRSSDPRARPQSAAAALARLERPAPAAADATAAMVAGAGARAPEAAPSGRLRDAGNGRLRRRLAAAGAAALVAGGLAIAVLDRGDGGDSGPAGAAMSEAPAGEAAGGADGGDAQPGGDEEAEPEAGGNGSAQPVDGADGSELNDRGFALINDGQPGEAVPVLRRAVDTLAGSGDITYAYALYNLGRALRLAGSPEEAIPILEARLEIPNQRDVVRRELEAARAAAGVDPGDGRSRDDDDD